MTVWRLLPVAVVYACWLILTAADDRAPATNGTNGTGSAAPSPGRPSSAPGGGPTSANSSRGNSTHRAGAGAGGLGVDSFMIQRALYVLIGITVIGVLYFLIRAVRLKKPAQRKKYGLLSNYDDSVEMDAVESEDDDTLYEARSLRR